MNTHITTPHPMKLSIIEHNPSALKGFLNNPKWYAYGHRTRSTRAKPKDINNINNL